MKPHCDSLTTYKFNFPLGLAFLLQLTSIYFLDLIRLIFMATQKANKKLHQSENYFAVKRIKESSLFVYSGSMTSFQLLFRDLYGIIWAGKTYAKVEAIYSLFTATHLKARERLKWVYGIEIELPARKKRNGAKRKESKSARKRRKAFEIPSIALLSQMLFEFRLSLCLMWFWFPPPTNRSANRTPRFH